MSCTITKNRALPCRDSIGGVKNVYFADYGELTEGTGFATDTDGTITSFATADNPEFFKYEVKNSSSLEQAVTASTENGTLYYEQTITVVLPKLSPQTHQQVNDIAKGRPHVVIEDNNGNFLLAGLKFGCNVTGGTISTGTAMGDMSGYSLTIAGMEPMPAYFVTESLVTSNVGTGDIDDI
jgi:hypothetical protein